MSRRTILVLRHAKTEPGGGGVDDFGRTLTPEGRLAAGRMGVRAKSLGFVVSRVVSSPAARAKETTELFLKAYSPGKAVDVEYVDAFYATDGEEIAKWLDTNDKSSGGGESGADNVLLIVGHNPSLEEFVGELAKRPAKLKPADMAAIVFGDDGLESLCFYRP